MGLQIKRNFLLQICCYFNRNLRFGDSKSRVLQFLVIRTRNILKSYIKKHQDQVYELGEVEVQLKYAGKLRLSTNDYIDEWLYKGADFEPHIVRLVTKILKAGDCFLDLGANIGYFSLIASKRIGAGGKVYAFEPTPATIKKIKKNIDLNSMTNIQLYEKAVSNQPGFISFQVPSSDIKNSGRASFRALEEEHDLIKVEAVVLNNYIEEFKTISLIKMDIEGAEAFALQGMTSILDRDRPLLIMELSDSYLRQLGSSAGEVITFLKERYYSIYTVGELAEKLTDVQTLIHHQYDIFCIPESKLNFGKEILMSCYPDVEWMS